MTWQTLQGLIGLYGAIVDRYAGLRIVYEPLQENSYDPYMLCNSMLNARSQSTFKIAPPLSND
ncbi:hypothetical protein RS3R6_14570 [Pseudomonas atacamensis]|uniref:Uncharacterized protein n=1 Tax=Pseudomonas atacamensis TaxID=2565368 RepID=A0ABQ5PKH4_9PSED|nr:hypothetical protein RS3R1_31530 [Pseudomonas atacamensis]GLH53276.1 hypothetical protein RS3R6_14570 [Pseudomonas atacamensis]